MFRKTKSSFSVQQKSEEKPQFQPKLYKLKLFRMGVIHALGIIGLLLAFTRAQAKTFYFQVLYAIWASIGVTAGAHRLWSHRAYKATISYRIFMMLAQTAAVQNDIYTWVRDHRVHHRFTETDADPHNIKRGVLFAHVGWLWTEKHPDVKSKGSTIDCSDILKDPVCAFQQKYYKPLIYLMALIIPTGIPIYFWNEVWYISLLLTLARAVIVLNGTWLVNSWAHLYGNKPYDRNIRATETLFVSTIASGEGFHNFHHVFPYDYRASELGWHYNITTMLIDTAARFGFVYDRKQAPKHMICKIKTETLASEMSDILNSDATEETEYNKDY